MKIVIDGSVWIAGIGSSSGCASQIIAMSYKSLGIEILITKHILDEVALNLEKKLKFDRTEAFLARQIIRNICDYEICITSDEINRIKVLKYNPDKPILALCKKLQADYLITFDRKHLLSLKKYKHTTIIDPKSFSEIIS